MTFDAFLNVYTFDFILRNNFEVLLRCLEM